MFNYDTLTEKLDRHLDKYSGVTTYTDIFEHALLLFLDYPFVPEKCQYKDNPDKSGLSIYLSTPYDLSTEDFVHGLRICATGKFSAIEIEEMTQSSNQENFCVFLSIPYTWININLSEIFNKIDRILLDPLKMSFYCSWDVQERNCKVDLTIIGIENLVRKKLIQYPHVTSGDVWSAIIQNNTGKDVKLKYLEKQVLVGVNDYPKITMTYEKNGKINKIAMPRDQIVKTLEEVNLDEFLIHDSTLQEFIAPAEINQFIEEKYYRSFSINKEGHYEIDLGYHREVRESLEIYGIREIGHYQPPTDIAEQSCYYVYDKKDYLRLLIALKEIKREPCLKERWHQLNYYICHEMWEKLDKELNFLLNLKSVTNVKVDYTDLLVRLFKHAKDNLQEKAQENTIEIIDKVCKHLVEKIRLQDKVDKRIYEILFELNLLRMNRPEDSEAERLGLKEESFLWAQKAGLKESNPYLVEMAGLKRGNTFSNDVNENPLKVLLELAKMHKAIAEENDFLRKKIVKLEEKNFSQEGRGSYFKLSQK